MLDIQPKIGMWYSMCCQRDICEIGGADDLEYLVGLLDDWHPDIYQTEVAALLDAKYSWERSIVGKTHDRQIYQDEIDECNKRIQAIL